MYARILTTLAMLTMAAAPSVATAQTPAAVASSRVTTVSARMHAPLAGVYQIGMASGNMVIPARLIVENTLTGINAMILTIDGSVSALKDVSIDGNTFRATVLTDRGLQRLDLRVTGENVEGTLGTGAHVWTITGTKTA